MGLTLHEAIAARGLSTRAGARVGRRDVTDAAGVVVLPDVTAGQVWRWLWWHEVDAVRRAAGLSWLDLPGPPWVRWDSWAVSRDDMLAALRWARGQREEDACET